LELIMNLKKTATNVAITMAMGGAAVAPQMASATGVDFSWSGVFTMLDAGGSALGNTSITTKGANTFQTPVTGSMTFDTATGAGTATLVPFAFFASKPSQPASAVGITMQAIGNGMGGSGTLVLGNMLFNWGGSYGIPVSIVMDAAGFFTNGAFSATPASDGTYTNAQFGYLNLGPSPMVTTTWNVHNAPDCGLAGNSTSFATGGGCMGNGTSGGLPLVADTALNGNKSYFTNTYGIGGVPMWDGPFTGFNANFDVTTLTPTGTGSVTGIAPFPVGPYPSNAVPVPAAVWLFGSGLIGLVGVARRNKKA
jgi:hypothetical protein